jgi:hypothetical protein
MPLIDFEKKEIHLKIVYYGPSWGGKTANLLYIDNYLQPAVPAKLLKIDFKGDRTLIFEFLPISLGKIQGFDLRVKLFTAPGRRIYNACRKFLLREVDGIVFVADSLSMERIKNITSLKNLQENLACYHYSLLEVPLVLQYNKRDLIGESHILMPLEQMEEDLNRKLQAPALPASSLTGQGVIETLKTITRLTAHQAFRKLGHL